MAIVPGAGTVATSGATDTATFPLTVNAGDYVFMAINMGAGFTTPATVQGPGAGQKAWTYLGQVAFGVFPQLWVLENAVAGSGNVTAQLIGRTYLFMAVQVYSGVGSMGSYYLPQSQLNANPAIAPGSATFFDVTVPGSMGVTGISFVVGTNVGLSLSGTRQLLYGSAQTLAIADGLFSTAVQQQLFIPWTNTSGTPNHTRVSVLFTPLPAVAVQVVISPTSASVTAGAVEQFIATVSGTPNTAVTWTASPGSIDATGLYTAPANIFMSTPGIVTATSVADPTQSASAVLNIIPGETIVPSEFGGGYRRSFIRSRRRGAIWSTENLKEA